MASLSDLLSAGGAGGLISERVASGALAQGDVVVLNSDGTVSAAAGDGAEGVGLKATADGVHTTALDAAWDAASGRVVLAYREYVNPGNDKLKFVVGTTNKKEITFGAPFVALEHELLSISICSVGGGKFACFYTDASGYLKGFLATLTGDTLSFGPVDTIRTAYSAEVDCTYDATSGKVVVAFRDTTAGHAGKAALCSISGASLIGGSVVQYAGGICYPQSIVAIGGGKVFLLSKYGSVLQGVIGTISGSSISFGSPALVDGNDDDRGVCDYDPVSGRVVVVYSANGPDAVSARTASVSGTSITYGPVTVLESAAYGTPFAGWSAQEDAMFVLYWNMRTSDYYRAVKLSLDGDAVEATDPAVLASGTLSSPCILPEVGTGRSVIAFIDYSLSAYVYQWETVTNCGSHIGFADSDVADGQTVEVVSLSGVKDGFSGLTVGAEYSVDVNGDLSADPTPYGVIGRAVSSDEIVVTNLGVGTT